MNPERSQYVKIFTLKNLEKGDTWLKFCPCCGKALPDSWDCCETCDVLEKDWVDKARKPLSKGTKL